MNRHSRFRSRYDFVMGQREDHFLRYITVMVIFLGFLLAPQIYKQYKTHPKLKAEAVAVFKNLTF